MLWVPPVNSGALRAASSRPTFGQTMLDEVVARHHGVGVQAATILLDAGARHDVRDNLLRSTSLGWASGGDASIW
jgi:hypothetical protein